ncbi:uncharacterized protein LOC129768777 [Toxorhynchites rutilus septentrionalis]|uniref:uncharacterized protein LOC129768777 n=1 Tax=Toxorhynchites rutilus septentrionalis TaxID=329112 RepID=UPI00247950D0|nr:uncharacterized protein LOC129768777 [Toxorhynchites rutilus septentrionalis]XP_055626618.1 uncharacterized protein LOC129768777 [Toxorhynchites rutilus septentrionalis]XP_055626619.1 uncharacterized protein LOC129768777 [Toxorhynchites rutilus septentrionalis]XP_055626621.1 uncharacterized protein LOC129768777 [Toxorhynchites rutilus septentrionalis]
MHNESTVQSTREKSLPSNVPESTNRSPLHEAASNGDESAVETLLAAGADRNAKESLHGNTPLHEAAWKGYSRCVKILCSLPKSHKPGTGTGTGSHPGGPKLSIDLIKDSSKIKSALQDTRGALHSALLGTRNFGGFSALHLAAQNGHNQSCREILLAGADPDVQNNYGDTPLHTACRYGHAGAIRILLSAKCDYERINLNGDTALHIACAMGRRKLTRILLEAGCRQDAKNAQAETPRAIAIRKNLTEIINILNTPVQISSRQARERSSSGSHRKGRDGKSGDRSRSRDDRKVRDKSKGRSGHDPRYDVDPQHWSPYGCHYFPDPRNFPSPKLETLPKEPLAKGEQYFLDLAGNIRKGPVGVGNTCYCAPFFKHLEQRMNQNRKSIRKYVNRATEKLDSRMTALAIKTDDQIEELTKTMIANRVQCENKRLHLEQWLKRGIAERATGPHNSKTKKDEANTNTLTRCRSLELLDGSDDVLTNRIKTSSPQLSRSIDFLDAPGSKHPDYSDHFESSNNSNIKNHSEADEPSRRAPLWKFDAEQQNGSKRSSSMSHSGRESYCYSDKDNGKEKARTVYQDRVPSSAYGGNSSKEDRKVSSSAESSNYDHKNEKIKVTERLEELLSKTKKILELEKITKKKHSDNRYILALDRLKDIHNYESNPQVYHQSSSKRDSPHQGYDIAQEMEKITQSLLPAVPVSPEISKDITTRKERSANSQMVYKNAGDVIGASSGSTPHSTMSPSSSLLGGAKSSLHVIYPDAIEVHVASTNFTDPVSDRAGNHEFEEIAHVDTVNIPLMNGFYANNCFEDIPSSSNTTIKSAPNHSRKLEQKDEEHVDSEEEDDDEDEEMDTDNQDKDWESDDQSDLSDMANFAQLKELKSRILNGTNWRNQALHKSVHDLFQKSMEPQENVTDEQDPDSMADEEACAQNTEKNRVKYIISKLQSSTIQQMEPVNSSQDQEEHFSETSEEPDDMDCVDGPSEQRPVTAKSLIEMYEKGLPKVENQPVAAVRQQYFVPKDAYFHELPNKQNVALKPPDLTSNLSNSHLSDQMPLTGTARSRNPLPTFLNENEILDPHQNQLGSGFYSNHQTSHYPTQMTPYSNGDDYLYQYHSHYVPQVPLQEKLLSSRKSMNPAASSFAPSNGSTATPSPEFSYQLASSQPPPVMMHHHLHPQHPPQQQPQSAQQFRKSQDNLSNDDSGYISAKVSEIHGPTGIASIASNGSPSSPIEVIPMPRQFIPYHMGNTAAVLEGGAVGGTGAGGSGAIYDEQHYNLGASSLV